MDDQFLSCWEYLLDFWFFSSSQTQIAFCAIHQPGKMENDHERKLSKFGGLLVAVDWNVINKQR